MNMPSIRVLLIEDNPADAVLMREALADMKHTRFDITHVKRLETAFRELAEKAYDVILLDLGLPDSQGMATLARLRMEAPDVPVVVLTGLDDEAVAVRAVQEGAQDYLMKGQAPGRIMPRAICYAIERKRAEIAARAREAELLHLSRVSTMGQMASGLAHELNQPLAAILNYASVCQSQLQSGKTSSEKMLAAIEGVMNETRRAGAIISRLRSFVRRQQPQSIPAHINELVQEALQLLEFELRHQNIRPRLQLAVNLPQVMADPVQIEQVLVNLIYNALEAIDGSKTKSLSVQTSLREDGRSLEVSLIDSGPGISPHDMERLFEPFFTTKPRGLGMGLNISRTIIESHGGRLHAMPNAEQGMRFCFTLPIMDGTAS
jgi:signal transduction histidine kinase